MWVLPRQRPSSRRSRLLPLHLFRVLRQRQYLFRVQYPRLCPHLLRQRLLWTAVAIVWVRVLRWVRLTLRPVARCSTKH